MKMVTAIVRTISLQYVIQRLEKSAKGPDDFRGQGARRGGRLNNPYSIHGRIEIVIDDEKADEAANSIL